MWGTTRNCFSIKVTNNLALNLVLGQHKCTIMRHHSSSTLMIVKFNTNWSFDPNFAFSICHKVSRPLFPFSKYVHNNDYQWSLCLQWNVMLKQGSYDFNCQLHDRVLLGLKLQLNFFMKHRLFQLNIKLHNKILAKALRKNLISQY